MLLTKAEMARRTKGTQAKNKSTYKKMDSKQTIVVSIKRRSPTNPTTTI